MSEQKYGPNTAEVDAYLALLPRLTDEQREASLEARWDASWDPEWHAATAAALVAAESAERYTGWWAAAPASWSASWAAMALVVRDLITPEQFDILTAPMRAAGIDFDALVKDHNEQEKI